MEKLISEILALSKSIAAFLLAGPAIGGLVFFALFTATRVIPDLIAGPGNQDGHDRTSEYFGTLVLVIAQCPRSVILVSVVGPAKLPPGKG